MEDLRRRKDSNLDGFGVGADRPASSKRRRGGGGTVSRFNVDLFQRFDPSDKQKKGRSDRPVEPKIRKSNIEPVPFADQTV